MSVTNPKQVNDFRDCLDRSHAASDLPFWEVVYRKAFSDLVHIQDERENGWWQQAGIDRTLVLAHSRTVRIDEKVRGRNANGKVYDDVALEFLSNDQTGALGWVCKPLLADYIAYAIAPLGKCYLLPVIQLQQAWGKNGEQWQENHGVREAQNKGYKTLFTPVPVKILFAAIGTELRVDFEKFEYVE